MVSRRERIEELAALVAAGAASGQERAELDALAASDPEAAAELAAFEEAAAALALSLEPLAPPPGALDSIRARLAEPAAAGDETRRRADDDPAPPPAFGPEPRSAERGQVISLEARRRQRRTGAVAVMALLAAAAFLFLWLRERDRGARALAEAETQKREAVEAVTRDAQKQIDELAAARRRAEREARQLAARFAPLQAAELELATLGSDGGGFAHVLADKKDRRWLVVAAGLPDIGDNQDYQLWFVPEDGAPVSAGLLRPGPDGVRAATPEVPDALSGRPLRPAISLEPRGGSPQPTQVKLMGKPI